MLLKRPNIKTLNKQFGSSSIQDQEMPLVPEEDNQPVESEKKSGWSKAQSLLLKSKQGKKPQEVNQTKPGIGSLALQLKLEKMKSITKPEQNANPMLSKKLSQGGSSPFLRSPTRRFSYFNKIIVKGVESMIDKYQKERGSSSKKNSRNASPQSAEKQLEEQQDQVNEINQQPLLTSGGKQKYQYESPKSSMSVKKRRQRTSLLLNNMIFKGINSLIDKAQTRFTSKNVSQVNSAVNSPKAEHMPEFKLGSRPTNSLGSKLYNNQNSKNSPNEQQREIENLDIDINAEQYNPQDFQGQPQNYVQSGNPDEDDGLESQNINGLEIQLPANMIIQSARSSFISIPFTPQDICFQIPDNIEEVRSARLSQRPSFIRKSRRQSAVNDPQQQPLWTPEEDRIIVVSPASRPNECFKKQVLDFMREATSNNSKKFIDVDFPPNLSSLASRPQAETQKQLSRYKSLNTWQRIKNIYSKQNVYITKYIDPNDLEQGSLLTSTILSVLSSLAESPIRIQKLLEDQKFSESGCYYVRICKDGIWRYIIVDDHFPLDMAIPSQQSQQLACSHHLESPAESQRNIINEVEIWVPLIEKALAKAYGTYQDLEMSLIPIVEILRELTGAPCKEYYLDELQPKDIYKIVKEALDNKYIIMLSNEEDINKKSLCAQKALPPDYSYTILSLTTTSIELRNPWGWIEDNQSRQFQTTEFGTFTIKISEVEMYFNKLVSCRVEDENYYIVRNIRHLNNAYSIQEFTLQQPGYCAFETTQLDQRLFRVHMLNLNNNVQQQQSDGFAMTSSIVMAQQKYTYSYGRLILCKKDEGEQWQFLGGISGNSKNLIFDLNLEPGTYRIIVSMDWQNNKVYDLALNYYGAEKIELKRINYKSCPNLICNVLEKDILKSVTNGKSTQKKIVKGNVVELIDLQENLNLIIITLQNTSNNTITHVKDLTKVNKNEVLLISIPDEKIIMKLGKLSTNEINSFKQNYGKILIELGPQEVKSLVFKIVGKQQQFDDSILQDLGLDQ